MNELDQVPGMYMEHGYTVPEEGTEIFRALIKDPADRPEYEENLEFEDVDSVLEQLANNRLLVISSVGLNGTGKGALNNGWIRIIDYNVKHNPAIRNKFRKKRIDLEIYTHPFALYAEAAKLPGIPPDLSIPADKRPAEYNFDDTHRASILQWMGITDDVERAQDPHKAIVIVQEGSVPLSFPVTNTSPVTVEGLQDLGMSSFCNAALDPRTRDAGFFYMLNRSADEEGKRAMDDAVLFRTRVVDKEESAETAFRGLDRLVVRTKGGIVPVRDLPVKLQKQIKIYLLKTFAPPDAIIRNERMLETLVEGLNKEGPNKTPPLIEHPEIIDFFRFIRRSVDMEGNNRFSIMTAKYAEGEKTSPLDYSLDSSPVRRYPQLSSPIDMHRLRNLKI